MRRGEGGGRDRRSEWEAGMGIGREEERGEMRSGGGRGRYFGRGREENVSRR